VIGCIPAATAPDVDLAVSAARRAFESGPWAQESYTYRATVLRKMANLVKERTETLAVLETLDMGKPIDESTWDLVRLFRISCAQLAIRIYDQVSV
jgi:betaine-aldehyde dehydrogenase